MSTIDEFKKAFAGKASPDIVSQRDQQVTAALKNFSQAVGGAADSASAKEHKNRLLGLVQRFDKVKKSNAPVNERLTEFDDILRQATAGSSEVTQSVAGPAAPVLNSKVADFVDVVETQPRNVPTGKEPDVSLGRKAEEPDIANIKIPEPCPTVSRDVVEQALTEWLIALGQAQKIKTKQKDMVMTTARVNLAEQTLLGKTGADGDTREGAHGRRCGREELEQQAITPFNGDGIHHDAAELAKTITRNLPKRLSQQNFDNFLKLRPVEAPVELSLEDQIRAKADSLANQVLSDFGVPKKYWGKIKEFAKNKTPKLIDKLPIDDTEKKLLMKAYKKLAKIKDEE